MTTVKSQVHLDMVYEGPSLDDGSMNVRDLAPALLAIGSLFEAANRKTNGDRASINVNVRATEAGSFQIAFEVIQNLGPVGVFDGPLDDFLTKATELKNLLLGGGATSGGLIGLIKWLRGRKPKVTEINVNIYNLTVDGETIEVPVALLRLFQDSQVRRDMQDVVRPVKESGINNLTFRDDGRISQQVSKGDLASFDASDEQELLVDEVIRKAFTIVSLAFKEDNKWRLTDGQNTFSVSMMDTAFQKRVDSNEIAFAKGDILICELHMIQWQVEDGIKAEYEVTQVVEYKPARQLRLIQ